MTSSDIMVRGAFFIAAAALLGTFTGAAFDMMNDAEENRLQELASHLSEVLEGISRMEAGSSATICLGEPPEGVSTSVVMGIDTFPTPVSIKVLPGAIIIESDGRREKVMESPDLIPAFPPDDERLLNTTLARSISRASGGFTSDLSTIIEAEVLDCSDGKVIFLHPPYNGEERPFSVLYEFEQLSAGTGSPVEYLRMGDDRDLELHSDGFILYHPGSERTSFGRCPMVHVVPSGAVIDMEEEAHRGPFLVCRTSETVENGITVDRLSFTPL